MPSSRPTADLAQQLRQACADLERRVRAAEPCRAEDILASYPDLASDGDAALEVIYTEYVVREQLGQHPIPADWHARFPQWRQQLEEVFQVHEAMADRTVETPTRRMTEPEAGSGAPSGPPERRVGPYELLGEIARGGMGVVYKARHCDLNRLVAVKMILDGDFAGTDERARFSTEAAAVAALQHPNIVQIFEVGEWRGAGGRAPLPFLALEYVDGGSLAQKLRAGLPPPREAAGLVEVLARTVHHAHGRGILHRDLKPANVLLTADGMPKVTDFGLAKRLGAEGDKTRTGAILGTPSYMAPEQAGGDPRQVGCATDTYALGAILYEALTGRPPFCGESMLDTLEQVRGREPLPPRQLQPKAPRDLETICLKCLRKEPAKRYVTAMDLADDLRRWLDGQPILARPVPVWERAWKWARRRPAAAAAAVLASVALLAGAGSAALFALVEHQKAMAREREVRGTRTVQDLYVRGQQAEAGQEFDEAKQHYDQALATLDAEPGAAGAAMRRWLGEGIERVSQRQKEKGLLAARHVFAGKCKEFRTHYDLVRFRAVHSPELDATEGAAAVRKEAPLALAQLSLDVATPQLVGLTLEPFRPLAESPDQLDRLAEECVEVLLAWADAETTAPAPAGPDRALRLLDSAAALGRVHGLGTSRALHLRRANCLELLHDVPGARAERERANRIAPATPVDHFDAALTSYRAGRTQEAFDACANVLQLHADDFWAQYLKALCYLRDQRWGEATELLDGCLRQKPDFGWLLSPLGVAHAGLKQYLAAEADFGRALNASSAPSLRAFALTNRSVLRRLQGRQNDAERDLRESIQLQPNVYQAYVTLADMLKGRDDRAGALELFDQALALSPENSALYSQRARLHALNGDRAAARCDFEQVIAREPPGGTSDRLVAARVELARLKHLDSENEAALADCDAVIAARPDFADAHRQRAEVLLALGGRNKEAGAALDEYLRRGGKLTPDVCQKRGVLHAQRGEYGAAVEAYTQALLLRRNAEILSNRGWAYLMQEALRPALDDFDAALKLNPKDADALAGRGTALTIRGRSADVAEATTAAEMSLQPRPWTVPRLMACAGIYTRAAGMLEAVNDPEAGRCLRRALGLLREAMTLVPEKERAAFWRDGVLTDPALLPLQRTTGLLELGRMYAP
jgi:tetratricopeptide (TPR) repeat protein